MTPSERKNAAYMLRLVFNDEELKTFRARALKAKETEPGDHQSYVLGIFAQLVDDIVPPTPPRKAADTAPDLAALERRFLGPKN